MYLLVFILALSTFDSGYCNLWFDGQQRQVRNTAYDYLIFSQFWPQSQCWGVNNLWQHLDASCTTCPVPQTQTGWSIHGLWPANRDGSHVNFCSSLRYHSILLNETLKSEMELKWLGYKLSSSKQILWKHEYEKHGSCAADIKSTDTLPKYFAKNLQLFELYEIGTFLYQSGIVSGNEYEASVIDSAIKQTLGVNSTLICFFHPESKDQYLAEIRLCFDQSFQLVDCSESSGSPDAECNNRRKIIYPKNLKACK